MKSAPLALDAIYLEFHEYLRSVVKKVGVPDADADDVVHDTIASLQEAGADYDPARVALKTWLYAAARNHARKYFRRVRASENRKDDAASLLDEVDIAVSPGPDPEEEILCREGRRILEAVLARMPQQRREVFECRHIRELPWAVIVARLGISRSTAMRHYEEALRELNAVYVRWTAGKAYALPFPLFLALSLGERRILACEPSDAANDVDARDASRLADTSSHPHDPTSAMPGAHPPARGADWPDRPSERAAACTLLQRVWRSRLTHALIGAVAGVAAMLLCYPFTSPGAPPPGSPPPSGSIVDDRPRPPSSGPTGASALPPGLPAGASSLPPVASAASIAPSTQLSARVPPFDPDAADRDLLNTAFLMASKGRRGEALDLLHRHASKYPDSKRSAQRAMLIAQLSD